jgi:hypothetical protein
MRLWRLTLDDGSSSSVFMDLDAWFPNQSCPTQVWEGTYHVLVGLPKSPSSQDLTNSSVLWWSPLSASLISFYSERVAAMGFSEHTRL